MLLNFSNHPYCLWGDVQKQAAINQFGFVEDMLFPEIEPGASKQEIHELAQLFLQNIIGIFQNSVNYNHSKIAVAVHVQGEFTFTFCMVNLLKESGIKCVASTSQRQTVDLGNGKKELQFTFVQFREY